MNRPVIATLLVGVVLAGQALAADSPPRASRLMLSFPKLDGDVLTDDKSLDEASWDFGNMSRMRPFPITLR